MDKCCCSGGNDCGYGKQLTEKEDTSIAMKKNINVLIICSMTVAVLLIVFFLWGCGGGGDSAATPQTSGGDIHTPVYTKN
jgi:hypothetical protein